MLLPFHVYVHVLFMFTDLMFSASSFKSSLSTISIKGVSTMPLWDFCASDFKVVLKIIIAEIFIVMTTSLS